MVRNIFSYILLISLLYPTVVEAFHAITDSHELHLEKNTNVNQFDIDCQINLFSNTDDDVSFFSEYSYELIISQNYFNLSLSYQGFEIKTINNNLHKRGPPSKA